MIGDAICPGCLTDSCALLKTDVVGYSGHMFLTKNFKNRVENGIALVPCKIDIDIGRIFALRIQESLKVEIVANWIDIGDSKTVRHYARRGASSAASTRCLSCNISHCKKIIGKALLVDDT